MPNPPRLLTVGNETRPLNEWAELRRIPPNTIRARLDVLGYTEAEAVNTPIDRRFSRGGGRPAADAPRPVPKLKRHAGGQAYCRWRAGASTLYRYLGPWGSAEAKAAYRRFAVEWADGLATIRAAGGGVTVNELIAAYRVHAERYYRKDGKPTGELGIIGPACRELRQWAGEKAVADIRRADLEGLQSHLAGRGLARTTVNKYVARVQRLFRWAAGEEGAGGSPLVPAGVLAGVSAVGGLKRGRSAAREPDSKRAVPWAAVEKTLPHLSPNPARCAVLADLIRVQWFAGMRPGEALRMRAADLDRGPAEWKYTVPGGGKQAHRGGSGVYWLGPKCKKIVSKYLNASADPAAPLFQLPRTGGRKAVRPGRDYYRRAVALACIKAGVPHWHPHQIRHSRATEIGALYESDRAAADAIGTSEDIAREVYRDPSDTARRKIARQFG
jgi:integrase